MACIDSRMLSTCVASPCRTLRELLAWRPRVNAYSWPNPSISSTAHAQCAEGLHFSAFHECRKSHQIRKEGKSGVQNQHRKRSVIPFTHSLFLDIRSFSLYYRATRVRKLVCGPETKYCGINCVLTVKVYVWLFCWGPCRRRTVTRGVNRGAREELMLAMEQQIKRCDEPVEPLLRHFFKQNSHSVASTPQHRTTVSYMCVLVYRVGVYVYMGLCNLSAKCGKNCSILG